jgi:two-component system sensor histidine kinase DegS
MLEGIAALAEQTSREARRAVWNLRAAPLEGRDFIASIEYAARQTIGAAPIWLGVRTVGRPRTLGARTQFVVLRVVGEAVANAVRHASARRIRVTLQYRPHCLRVSVVDDGRGFAIEPNCRSDTRSCGLLGMRERACEVSASLEIRSALGEGTRIILAVPFARSTRDRRPAATATSGAGLSR